MQMKKLTALFVASALALGAGYASAAASAAKPATKADDKAKEAKDPNVFDDWRLQCAKPTTPSGTMDAMAIAKSAMTKLFPIAMACDLTRVVVFENAELATTEFGAPAVAEVHGDYAHSSGSPGYGSASPRSTGNTGAGGNGMVKYYATHAQQFADMVAAFKAVPEGNGTMLDNSVLVWAPEIANGWHDYQQNMFILASGGGGAFRPGRYLKYRSDGPDPSPVGGYGYTSSGPAHNKLWVSIMQAIGLPNNSIGLASATGLRNKKGMACDMTGPLPRLA